MTRLAALTLALAVALGVPPAAMAESQLERSVASDLRRLGFRDVDVSRLTPAQLAAIHHIANEKRESGGRRGQIRSVLGGQYSLRGLFE